MPKIDLTYRGIPLTIDYDYEDTVDVNGNDLMLPWVRKVYHVGEDITALFDADAGERLDLLLFEETRN